MIVKNNHCVIESQTVECDSGMYFDVAEKTCRFCDISCSECTTSEFDKCINCTARRPFLLEGKCVSHCEPGYYLDKFLKRCLKCSSNCLTCEMMAKKCLTCADGFKLSDANECLNNIIYGK